jgi:hypothetical protein
VTLKEANMMTKMKKNHKVKDGFLRRRAVLSGLNAERTASFLKSCFIKQGRLVKVIKKDDKIHVYASRGWKVGRKKTFF